MRLAVIGAGMVTSLGLSAPATCAAIRSGRRRFQDTRFKHGGEWVVGAPVSLAGGPRGTARALAMVSAALDEAIEQLPSGEAGDTAWALCLSEPERPGRPAGLEDALLGQLRPNLREARRLCAAPELFAGRLSPLRGLRWLEQTIAAGLASHGILAAVDGYLHTATLAALRTRGRSALVPGEAAGAVALSAPREQPGEVECLGLGWGRKPRDGPVSGRGLAEAYREALSEAGLARAGACGFAELDYRVAELDGGHDDFKQAALALARTMRVRKASFELWNIADSVGYVGAAAVPLVLGLALDAAREGYAPGPGVLAHFSAEDGERAALVLRERGRPSTPTLTATTALEPPT